MASGKPKVSGQWHRPRACKCFPPTKTSDCEIRRSALAYVSLTVDGSSAVCYGGKPIMSKPILTALVVGVVATAGLPVVPSSAGAAELLAPPAVHARHHGAACGVALVAAFTSVTSITGNYDRPTV